MESKNNGLQGLQCRKLLKLDQLIQFPYLGFLQLLCNYNSKYILHPIMNIQLHYYIHTCLEKMSKLQSQIHNLMSQFRCNPSLHKFLLRLMRHLILCLEMKDQLQMRCYNQSCSHSSRCCGSIYFSSIFLS